MEARVIGRLVKRTAKRTDFGFKSKSPPIQTLIFVRGVPFVSWKHSSKGIRLQPYQNIPSFVLLGEGHGVSLNVVFAAYRSWQVLKESQKEKHKCGGSQKMDKPCSPCWEPKYDIRTSGFPFDDTCLFSVGNVEMTLKHPTYRLLAAHWEWLREIHSHTPEHFRTCCEPNPRCP